MFIRFRQTKTRLQASLVQTRREGGCVRNEHVAALGTVDEPASVAGRLAFWKGLHERMARLGNRLDAAAQARLLGEIHARIPMVTAEEQRALQLENAKADAEAWGTLADMHAEAAEGQAGVIASAERAKAAAAAERAKAAEHAAGAKERVARIERGEDVPGGLGKPLSLEDARAILLSAGLTKADIAHCVRVSQVSDAFGFDAMLKVTKEAADRAERRALRALHRRIARADGER